jgi:hypothetical protein
VTLALLFMPLTTPLESSFDRGKVEDQFAVFTQ